MVFMEVTKWNDRQTLYRINAHLAQRPSHATSHPHLHLVTLQHLSAQTLGDNQVERMEPDHSKAYQHQLPINLQFEPYRSLEEQVW